MLEEISAAMEANEDQYVEIEEGKNLQGGLISSFGNTYVYHRIASTNVRY